MPKTFTEEEKERINESLKKAGEKHFARYGVKKTNVEELTREAGISKGSFYAFFPSKEELYMQILERAEYRMKEEITSALPKDGRVTRDDFKNMLVEMMKMINRIPFARKMLEEDEYEYLVRKLPRERVESHVTKDSRELKSMLEVWRKAGALNDIDINAGADLIRALFAIVLKKDEFSLDNYENMLELLAESLADKFIKKEGKENDRNK